VRARAAWGGFLPDVRARVALVTLPLGVLQAPPRSLGGVRFVPLLPAEKRAAISALGMGSVVKLVVRFRASLTSALAPSLPADACFIHAPRAPVPTWWRPLPLPPTVMVGWVGGPAAARFATGDSRRPEIRRQMVERALRGLARELGMSPLALCNSVEDAQVFDWAADPFARGAYSWVPVGALNAGAALAAAVDGCLFFAGEACDSDGDPGTVHGALASGARAATEIIRRTRQLRR
jgi:monoamine oxidase